MLWARPKTASEAWKEMLDDLHERESPLEELIIEGLGCDIGIARGEGEGMNLSRNHQGSI